MWGHASCRGHIFGYHHHRGEGAPHLGVLAAGGLAPPRCLQGCSFRGASFLTTVLSICPGQSPLPRVPGSWGPLCSYPHSSGWARAPFCFLQFSAAISGSFSLLSLGMFQTQRLSVGPCFPGFSHSLDVQFTRTSVPWDIGVAVWMTTGSHAGWSMSGCPPMLCPICFYGEGCGRTEDMVSAKRPSVPILSAYRVSLHDAETLTGQTHPPCIFTTSSAS